MAKSKKDKPEKKGAAGVLSKTSQAVSNGASPNKSTKSGQEKKPETPANTSPKVNEKQQKSAGWRNKTTGSNMPAAGKALVNGASMAKSETRESFAKASNFLNEVLAEYRRVSWPTRSQVARETVSVLFLVLIITTLVWLFDLVVGKLIFSPLEHLGHLYGIGASH
jgi:preprotein translocase subunit SecE